MVGSGTSDSPAAAAAAAAAAASLQSCPTLRPHRRQPTRLPRPWDSPGKNTGVGCHFLLQCRKVKVKSLRLSRPHGLQPTRLLRPRDFPGKSTGVGCHCLHLQTAVTPNHSRESQIHVKYVPLNSTTIILDIFLCQKQKKDTNKYCVCWKTQKFLCSSTYNFL